MCYPDMLDISVRRYVRFSTYWGPHDHGAHPMARKNKKERNITALAEKQQHQ